jgi:hypothetical protein
MVNNMEKGQMIKLRAYGHTELERRVVRIDKDVVSVCRPEEYEKAIKERREPISVGFHFRDIINN